MYPPDGNIWIKLHVFDKSAKRSSFSILLSNEIVPGTADPTDVLLRNLFDSADANSDEYISKMEFRMFIIGSADLNGLCV